MTLTSRTIGGAVGGTVGGAVGGAVLGGVTAALAFAASQGIPTARRREITKGLTGIVNRRISTLDPDQYILEEMSDLVADNDKLRRQCTALLVGRSKVSPHFSQDFNKNSLVWLKGISEASDKAKKDTLEKKMDQEFEDLVAKKTKAVQGFYEQKTNQIKLLEFYQGFKTIKNSKRKTEVLLFLHTMVECLAPAKVKSMLQRLGMPKPECNNVKELAKKEKKLWKPLVKPTLSDALLAYGKEGKQMLLIMLGGGFVGGLIGGLASWRSKKKKKKPAVPKPKPKPAVPKPAVPKSKRGSAVGGGRRRTTTTRPVGARREK